MASSFSIQGNLVDVHQKKIYAAQIFVEDERIVSIKNLDLPSPESGINEKETPNPKHHPEASGSNPKHFILPGFIDAHVHIESSMLVPSEFAKLAVVHGTVATVSDPHEIANVCGLAGVEFMIEDGNTVPFKFNFGAPSCVPATSSETAGAAIDANDIDNFLRREDVLYLTEMMNFPGVLNGDEEVMKKIATAKKYGKPVDGHAPGLLDADAKKYIDAGISTDHECFTKKEALDKLQHGMKILIREGSAAKNFEALIDLLHEHEDMMMFCSDDKHPDSLVDGHINQLCARAVAKGIDVFKILQAACVNPVNHYKLKVGLLRENDFADCIVVKDLKNFELLQTYVNGQLVAEGGKSLISSRSGNQSSNQIAIGSINNFHCTKKNVEDFVVKAMSSKEILNSNWLHADGVDDLQLPVIEALDGQLITNKIFVQPKIENGCIVSDVANDILKIVVVNRYQDAPIAKAFIKNFGLKKGAIASSVAHDSHNIVAVGVDDESICRAVNAIIESKGGVYLTPSRATSGPSPRDLERGVAGPTIDGECLLQLPVAGLMSTDNRYLVAEKYKAMDAFVKKELGSTLSAPFMTLSFMALLVIPHLKLSDMGLFDGDSFQLMESL